MSSAPSPTPRRSLKFRHAAPAASHTGVKSLFFLLFCGAGALFLWTPSLYLWQSLKHYEMLAASQIPSEPVDETISAAPTIVDPSAQNTDAIVLPARDVMLALLAPAARHVFVGGSFNNFDALRTPMKRRPDGVWEARLKLSPGRYLYKFKVDGEWKLDPTNPQKTLEPRSASVLDLP